MNILNAALTSTYNSHQYGKPAIIQQQIEEKQINFGADKKKVKTAALIGSAIGIAGAVAAIYKSAKKGNPNLNFSKLTYEENDILLIGAGSVLGGLTGGLIADKNKKNVKPKLREASQQFFGSMLCPISILSVANKALEKSGFKMPLLKSNSKTAQVLNIALKALPKVAVTICSLIAGMEIGNRIMNKVNNKIFKEDVKRDVHASDYLVHTDDLCLAANLILKDTKTISKVTTKILPATFLLAGTNTGTQEA